MRILSTIHDTEKGIHVHRRRYRVLRPSAIFEGSSFPTYALDDLREILAMRQYDIVVYVHLHI